MVIRRQKGLFTEFGLVKFSFWLFVLVNKQVPSLVQSVPLFDGVLAPVGLGVILRSGHGGMTLLACQQGHTLSLNHPPTDVCARIHSFWRTQIFVYSPSGLILPDRWLASVCVDGWYSLQKLKQWLCVTSCKLAALFFVMILHHIFYFSWF